jgi:hypothetical protein
MDDVMRRVAAVDAPPPVARAASTLEEPLTPPQRYSSLDDVMRRAPNVDAPPPVARERVYTYYETLLCETCGSADHEDDLILCDRCDRGHHTFCLRPIVAQVPIGPWFCPICVPPNQAPKSASLAFPTFLAALHGSISPFPSPSLVSFLYLLPCCLVVLIVSYLTAFLSSFFLGGL